MVRSPHGTFSAPSTLLFGGGARLQLAGELEKLSVKSTLVVTDSYLRSTGVLAEFQELLEAKHIETAIFSEVQPDPTDTNVAAGLEHLRNSRAKAIVAIGGGSVIDAAKIIGVAATNPQPIREFQGYEKITHPGLPLIVVPTTAGTGSEATKVAVITDTAREVKMMILDRNLMPAVSIVDYELSLTMPPKLTAYVGVDTLVHGVEAFVSRKANSMTDPLALSCIRLAARHLPVVYQQPDNHVSRGAMAIAACQGGMAFTNSGLCLVHGMSRPLGAVFHLPHGLSNAVLFPTVTRFSLQGAPDRYANAAREMSLCETASNNDYACQCLVEGLEKLNTQLGIPRVRDCIEESQSTFDSRLSKMAEDALASGSPQNNPVVPSAAEIIDLYREAW